AGSPVHVLDQGKGFLQGEGTFVQGGAHDGALHPLVNQSGDGTQVVQAGHPAAGHDGLVGVLAHSTQQLQVGALEHAVLVDVGDHVAGAPLTLQALQGFQQVTALAGPTTCGQGRATHVQTDGDPVTVFGDDLGAPFGVFQCGRTDVYPGASVGRGLVQRCVAMDPAGQYHRHVESTDDVTALLPVVAPAERRAQVHQVDPLGSGVLPGLCRGEGVTVPASGVRLALDELDGLAARHV